MNKGNLVRLGEAYASHLGLELSTVSTYAANDGKWLAGLKGKASCTLRKADTVVEWFSDRWPADLEWPRDIPRPPKIQKGRRMMRALNRLRRSVALFVCPELWVPEELGVGAMAEPKASGRFMTAEERFNLECRIFRAADPWREVLAWLKESRDDGWRLPKDGDAFVGQMVLLAASISVGVSSDEAVKIGPADRADHDAAAAAVRLEELAATLPAGQRVVGDGLKDRLDLLVIAGCAYGVRGFTVGLAVLKFIHERALLGAGERVANGLGLKAVDAALFLMQLQKRALHRYLLRLQPKQTIEQVRDQLLRRSGIDIRLIDQGLDVLCSVRRTLGEAYEASARSKDSGHGF